MKQNDKVVFITGGNGFIGSNLTKYLVKKGFKVHLLVRKNSDLWRLKNVKKKIKIYPGDIEDLKKLSRVILKINPNYIIHLASYGNSSEENNLNKIVNANIIGLVNLLEASKNINYKKLIVCGSSSEYGFKDKPMIETDFLVPNSYYSAAKSSASLLSQSYALENKKPIVILRLFSVYGPYEEKNRFISTIITNALANKQILVTKENVKRDFIYIDDVVNAFYNAMTTKINFGEIINIGTGKQYSNKEVVKIIEDILNKKLKLGVYPKRNWDTNNWVSNNSKAKRVLKWKPEFSIRDGLRETVRWNKKN
jgi:nucleoside-diphosphate-sugar epimerase